MTKTTFLSFEQSIAELETKIEELRFVQDDSAVDISEEIDRLSKKSQMLTKDIYAKLTPWQVSQISRHPQRPYTMDYVNHVFTDFHELHGDRSFADDQSIVGGLARFNGQSCMVIGHQKGRDTKERAMRNFGMPKPEGYRKAMRLMKLAEKFDIPVFTFVDTTGAWPGIDAEERGQSEAIGHNLYVMAELKVPLITTIIGEGGSGGALALAVGDAVLMLQYATYSVISPEGCASILWKTSDRASDAAEALGLTAHRLKAMGLIDKIINEPLGGAHRDPKQMCSLVKRALADTLRQFQGVKTKDLLSARHEKLMSYGKFKETKISE
ncbi:MULTISPECIES: acetyl-CoA carboxylase carboxyltransferase subunit alpha [unclassified Undibacterium]|jgi:acetyl-CoA carboxylase carboxyl transferase subunit alpha|uniref:acetyl-CoA carboxylase carboxyltransferase subunit alpha n=1 Tax=unclassified Undibacterium TaxID=2630295 RepID=UPI00164B1FA0|nr:MULTISPECIES: acetyl-CoA carboxylase carboxyltransferase subunit alpha [unclassified Undibacterium]MBC3879034.1 acetyl-CoA carboxylase carboxyltransferase subunit alpha [Undibacterium sp. FT79W]MBC3928217.1 acetyl-CoA carboxylase carboxyltransferase subunit alpha [Undibacterium sp. CY21W]MBK1891016.1 acetyl-CoA carboxylase carboxyltransferase subunit alpha [Undibacterium sp. 14-3-2]MBY0570348.1 acetyl-CoA carboxylase carboxyltransferase subunit alpha [Burkholderiaceae bacterium]